jgi:hypothetical protein
VQIGAILRLRAALRYEGALMRARVGVTTRNRLLRLERFGVQQQCVGGWPPIMGLDEWEALASGMQDELRAFGNEYVKAPPKPQPYEPKPMHKADDALGEQRKRSPMLHSAPPLRWRCLDGAAS